MPQAGWTHPPCTRAEIAKLADEKLIEARAERDKLTLLLTAPVEQAKPKQDEDAAERVTVSLRKFHERMATPEQRKAKREETERKRQRAEHSRRIDYIRQGFEPPTNKHGIAVSISLARATGMELKCRAPAPSPRHDFHHPNLAKR